MLPVDSKGAGSGFGNLAAAATAFGVNVPSGDAGDANFVDILNSRTIREQLLRTEFAFQARAWRFGAERTQRQTLAAYLNASNPDRGVRVLGAILSVSRDQKSKIIMVSAETNSPDLSQQIVRKTLQLLESFVQEKGRTRGGAKAAFAEARLAEARGDMLQFEDEFRRFLDGNRNYQVSAEPSVRLKGVRLESEFKLRQQLVSTLSLNREQALLEEKSDIPILNVLEPGNLPIEKSRPTRGIFVMVAFMLGTVSCWVWINREWIREYLLESSKEPQSSAFSKEHA